MDEVLEQKILEVAQGNPGALSVLMMVIELPEIIDYLWEFGPRAEGVCMLYKDVCGEDIGLFCQVIVTLMRDRLPDVWLALGAEAEAKKFAMEWERYGYENYG